MPASLEASLEARRQARRDSRDWPVELRPGDGAVEWPGSGLRGAARSGQAERPARARDNIGQAIMYV